MKHGVSSTIFTLVVLIVSFFSVHCRDAPEKSKFEKIKEIVAKNMHILGPMLNSGPSEEMVDYYLKVILICLK